MEQQVEFDLKRQSRIDIATRPIGIQRRRHRPRRHGGKRRRLTRLVRSQIPLVILALTGTDQQSIMGMMAPIPSLEGRVPAGDRTMRDLVQMWKKQQEYSDGGPGCEAGSKMLMSCV